MYAPAPKELQSHGIEAESFEALSIIAIETLKKQGPSSIVCGPITTGGTGHPILNFEVFNATIEGLGNEGVYVFNQAPYEYGLRKLMFAWEEAGNKGYCMPILTVFYASLFESGLIERGWFIPGWQSSHGARFERDKFQKLKIPITDLALVDIRRFMEKKHSGDHVSHVLNLLAQETQH